MMLIHVSGTTGGKAVDSVPDPLATSRTLANSGPSKQTRPRYKYITLAAQILPSTIQDQKICQTIRSWTPSS